MKSKLAAIVFLGIFIGGGQVLAEGVELSDYKHTVKMPVSEKSMNQYLNDGYSITHATDSKYILAGEQGKKFVECYYQFIVGVEKRLEVCILLN